MRKTAKPTGVQPLRDAITTLLCVELEKLLGRSKLLKAPKPPPAVTGCVVLAAGGVALFLLGTYYLVAHGTIAEPCNCPCNIGRPRHSPVDRECCAPALKPNLMGSAGLRT